MVTDRPRPIDFPITCMHILLENWPAAHALSEFHQNVIEKFLFLFMPGKPANRNERRWQRKY